jgi:hypothetical protein
MENNEERKAHAPLNGDSESNLEAVEGLHDAACCASSFLEDGVFRGVWNSLDELCGEDQVSREMIKSTLNELWTKMGSKAYEDDPDYDGNPSQLEIASRLNLHDPRDSA